MVHRFPEPTALTQPRLRVLQVPGEHAYVRHLQPVAEHGALFSTLPDPTPPVAPGSWHPSVVLDPGWQQAHAGTFDVVHLHFGYEHLTPAEVTSWAAAVHAAGAALVVTVHDIDNPHLTDQTRHHDNLRAALDAADRIVTLTSAAACALWQRWGVEAVVIPHPHLLPLTLVGTRAAPRSLDAPQVGVSLGALRANIDTAAVLDFLDSWPGPTPTVRVSQQLFDDRGADDAQRKAAGERLLSGAQEGRWRLDVVEPGVPDEQIWRWLSSLDALLLPYRWGTHSGWVEACADVGTAVIAPRLGCWADQRPVLTVPRWAAAGVIDAAAVLHRLGDRTDGAGGGLLPLTRAFRVSERSETHRLHDAVYRSS
ncbi:MAG: hypothetical protein WKF57_14745 [Nakamurella sp.]